MKHTVKTKDDLAKILIDLKAPQSEICVIYNHKFYYGKINRLWENYFDLELFNNRRLKSIFYDKIILLFRIGVIDTYSPKYNEVK